MTSQNVRPFGGTPSQGIAQIKAAGLITKTPSTQGVPKPVSNVSVKATTLSGGRIQLAVSFTQNPSDQYVTGYKLYLQSGKGNPTVIGEGAASPLTVTIDASSSPSVVIVQSVGNWGSTALSSSPTASVNISSGNISSSGMATLTYKSGGGSGNYTRTSSTLANVDGTNLAITVTIPTGWKLGVWAAGVVQISANTTSAILAIRDGSTTYAESQANLATSGNAYPWSLVAAIPGDGASHTVTLQFASSDNASTVTIPNTGTNFPTMVFLLTQSR